jgi:hypothetical protein
MKVIYNASYFPFRIICALLSQITIEKQNLYIITLLSKNTIEYHSLYHVTIDLYLIRYKLMVFYGICESREGINLLLHHMVFCESMAFKKEEGVIFIYQSGNCINITVHSLQDKMSTI